MCDALQTPRVSPITSGSSSARQVTAVAVSEQEVAEAVRFAWAEHQLVVEPGGGAALAALLSGKVEAPPRNGGNIVRWQCRFGAARSDRRRAPRRPKIDSHRARGAGIRALDRAGRFLELGGESLEFGGERLGIRFGHGWPRHREGTRASSRCTAGSSPRSGRTPLRGELADRRWPWSLILDQVRLSVGEGEGSVDGFSSGGDGADDACRIRPRRRRGEAGAEAGRIVRAAC